MLPLVKIYSKGEPQPSFWPDHIPIDNPSGVDPQAVKGNMRFIKLIFFSEQLLHVINSSETQESPFSFCKQKGRGIHSDLEHRIISHEVIPLL